MKFEQFDNEVASLLERMTLREKIGQLTQFSDGAATGPDNITVDQSNLAASGGIGSVLNLTGAQAVNALQKVAVEESRLKIPILFALDVIHGYQTIYPIPLGLAASWNLPLVEQCARMAAVEATSAGIRWTFSPMVDVARDARWGRVMEGSGEDPHVGERMAAAWVRGYQGTNLSEHTSMLACAKHFVAYGAVEGGRDYDLVDISDRALRDVYLPPFKAALDVGVGTIMSAFQTLSGVPASANRQTLTGILRSEWGFQGVVVSDWNSIGELIPHGLVLDGSQAALKALTAGVDMDMQSNLYITQLEGLVGSGKLKVEVIDDSVARVLRLKFALGLFSQPYTEETLSASSILTPEHLQLARQAAEESFVLLKNDPGTDGRPILPLPDGSTVALIGSLADSKPDMLGAWANQAAPDPVVTLRQSLLERLKGKLIYAPGLDEGNMASEAESNRALAAADQAEVVIMALGESREMSGEARSRSRLDLPGDQLQLLQKVVATGKPVVLILFNGRPLAIPWAAANVPTILEAWIPGLQAGPALVRVLYGEINPSGKLTATFPRSVGQMPLYYNHFNTGRPAHQAQADSEFVTGYADEQITPLFPFGWGLSYTKFDYSPARTSVHEASAAELNDSGSITVEATVTNTGSCEGSEIVQLYIRQRGTSVVRPIRELKAFEKIHLVAGEARCVQFILTKKELAFWNIDMELTVEPCELAVYVAAHSAAGRPTNVIINL